MVSKAALDTLSAKLLFVVSGLVALLCAAPAWAFSLDDVVARAKALSDRPYAAPVSNLPPEFRGMQFADYQKIEPRQDKDQWADLNTPFKLRFYHQGMQFNTPVKISEIVGDKVSEIRYDPARFDFGDLKFDRKTTSQLGYAGFRVMYPVNQPGKLDEAMSLLGASYFRVIGKGQVYGLSARGLAIDSGLAKPEEFPAFREFWVQRPQPQDGALVFYALLDSPRATGAYRFALKMGGDAVLDVQARVFMRGTVDVLGVAPLTSMFLYGPNQRREANNFRPALHDSDGLAIHAGDGEWIWRPLNNPKNVALSYFQVDSPKGFGLLQRNHDFANYLDLADRYDLRPSAWIEPLNDWGKGNVELVEIPSPDETNDNIVAFWTPATLPPKGQPIVADYRIHWTLNEPALLDKEVGWVKDTLRADGEVRQANLIRALDGSTMLMADFTGPVLAALPADAKVEAQVGTNDNVEILENTLQPNPAIHGWRVALRVKVKDPARAAELRGALVSGGKAVTETWSYQLPPHSIAAQ